MSKNVAPPRKGLAGLVDHVAVVTMAMEGVGGKLEEAKDVVATTMSCSEKRVVEGFGLVGLEVVGSLVEDEKGEEVGNVVGDEVAVVDTVVSVCDVVGDLGLVGVEESVKEKEVGVVQAIEVEERSVDVMGAPSESAVTGTNRRSPLRLHHGSSFCSYQHSDPPGALKQKTPNFWSGFANHITTPVFPTPQFLLAVSRGITAVCSAVQPYLQKQERVFLCLGEQCPGNF